MALQNRPFIIPFASNQDVVSQSVAVMIKYLWFLYMTLCQWAQAQNSAFCKEYPQLLHIDIWKQPTQEGIWALTYFEFLKEYPQKSITSWFILQFEQQLRL